MLESQELLKSVFNTVVKRVSLVSAEQKEGENMIESVERFRSDREFPEISENFKERINYFWFIEYSSDTS